MTLHDYRQAITASGIITGLGWAAVNILQGDVGFAGVLLLLTCLLILVLIRLVKTATASRVSHAEAQEAAAEADVLVYWRPGCVYCDRLKIALGSKRADVVWVNVLGDEAAARFVAELHAGNETVPTVVTGAGEVIAPTAAEISERLRLARS